MSGPADTMGTAGDPVTGTGPKSQIQAVDRSVALLDAVARAGPGGASLRELCETVGLHQSTGRTILAALVLHGLVAQHEQSRRYRLGPRVFSLNQIYLAQTELAVVSAPVLRRLWELTAETVHLAVLQGSRRVDISVLVGPQLLNINPSARASDGASVPLERTAAGKVLLAGLDAEELMALRRDADWEYFAAHPRPLTETLLAELRDVRAQGYATNVEEGAIGVCGVAAPVLDQIGRTVAALCVGYPAARYSPEYADAMLKAVRDAAAELSTIMGAQPTAGPQTS
jgi:DNA-binding IclR family transcriptional regulator